jgi:hypothetical protein
VFWAVLLSLLEFWSPLAFLSSFFKATFAFEDLQVVLEEHKRKPRGTVQRWSDTHFQLLTMPQTLSV